MTAFCREPNCPEPAASGGAYCRRHECSAPDCHEKRCDEARAYCHEHDAEHYRRTGRHAFWHEVAEPPEPAAPPSASPEPGVPEGAADEPATQTETPVPPAVLRAVQGLALLAVAGLALWGLFVWLGLDTRDAGPEGPAGLEAPGDLDQELRLRESDPDDGIEEALEERGFR
jgi:hypothetical protein